MQTFWKSACGFIVSLFILWGVFYFHNLSPYLSIRLKRPAASPFEDMDLSRDTARLLGPEPANTLPTIVSDSSHSVTASVSPTVSVSVSLPGSPASASITPATPDIPFDLQSCTKFVTPSKSPPPGGPKRVISFGLYGADPKYVCGLLMNVMLQPTIYPGWTCRVYLASGVPRLITELLRSMDVEVFPDEGNMPVELDTPGRQASLYRFAVAEDPAVDVWIVRDVDSRISLREKVAVEEFLASNKSIHIMRDHPAHSGAKICAGMWGGRGVYKDMVKQIVEYFKGKPGTLDQGFLQDVVYPRVEPVALQHDAFSCRRYGGIGFPTARKDPSDFVGQVYSERDEPRMDYARLLAAAGEPAECQPRAPPPG